MDSDPAPEWADTHIKQLENELAAMRNIKRLEAELADLRKEHAYLKSRDRLCSDFANRVNKLEFENAKRRGEYVPPVPFNAPAKA